MTFPAVALSVIARPVVRQVTVIPGTMYRTIGVKWWGEGAYERETIDGSQTAAKTLTTVRENDLIINKIWVRHGSTAIATKAVDGCSASGEFPTFELDRTRVLPRWIHWLTKTRGFWSECDNLSRGTSGKNRIKPELFLTIKVPLPPREEQRRIVARIEELAAKIEEAKRLRQQSIKEANSIGGSELNAYLEKAKLNGTEFRSIGGCTIFDRYGPRFYNESYSEEGVRIMRATDIDETGRVEYRFMPKMAVTPIEKKKLLLKAGDLVVVRSGSVGLSAVFDRRDLECIPAAYLIQFRFDETVNPYFIQKCLQSPVIKDQLTGRGTALKNVNAVKIKSLRIPIPSLSEQERFVNYFNNLQMKIDLLRHLQAETAAELDALLPSVLDKAFKGEL